MEATKLFSRFRRGALSLVFGRRLGATRSIHLRSQRQTAAAVGTQGAARSTSTRTAAVQSRRPLRPPSPHRLSPDPSKRGGDDEYRWMHDIDNDDLLRHLEQENRHSAAHLRPLRRRASELFRCMVDRQPEEEGGDRRSVPERLGSYLYYTRRDDGKGFPVYVRRPVEGALEDEQVVFDLNEIEERGGLCGGGSGAHLRDDNEGDEVDRVPPPTPTLGLMKLSPDQRMLVCTVDVDGSDRFALAVFDLTVPAGNGREGPGGGTSPAVAVSRVDNARWGDVVGVEWGSIWPPPPEARTDAGATDDFREGGGDELRYELYYTVPDELRRPWQVRRVWLHRSTSAEVAEAATAAAGGGWRVDCAGDHAVFEETDDAFFVDVGKTKDHAYVVVNVHSKTTSEVHLLTAAVTGSVTTPDPDIRWAEAAAEPPADDGTAGEEGCGAAASTNGDRRRTGPKLLRRRRRGVEYYVDHSGDAFYLVTNSPLPPPPPSFDGGDDGGPGDQGVGLTAPGEYHLVRVRQPPERGGRIAPLEGIADAPWEAVPYARDGGTIQEMDVFKDHCVLYESCPASGGPRLRVVPLGGGGASSSSSPFIVYPPAVGGRESSGCAGAESDCGGDGVSDGGSSSGGGCADGKGRYSSRGSGSDRNGGGRDEAATASGTCTLRPGVNSWFEARTARFSLSSPTAPEEVYDLCLDSGRVELRRRTAVPGNPRFDGREYSCYTTQVAARNGATVPLTIAHRRGLQLDGNNRLLLHGYGAYGMSLPLDYTPGHACMLERDWVLAFAHVRGGGERGKAWHAAGRGVNKWNSFWDFEACAEHLVSEGFTSPSSMGLHVNSAGGLLGGVMANSRPGLFSAMVMKAPFLGVLSAMRDSSLPLTVHEYDEWGDPNSNREAEAMIRSYCPYENIREQEYPALLVTASLNDNRVNVWDPAKWVARVRAANTGNAPVLLRVSERDGHHGPGNTMDGLKDSALEMAFLEEHLSVVGGGH